jgi:hypothetical protein
VGATFPAQEVGVRSLLLWLLLASPAWALGPFEKNHPLVEQGMAAYGKGDFEGALKKFEEAKKELPRSAAVEFDRANALFKLGRLEEAKDAYQRVTELDPGELKGPDYYNLGNVWASLGKDKEAIAAYRKALTLNHRDAMARHHLEVILRKLPPPKKDGAQDGGTPDAGTPDGGRPDAGQDAGTPDAGPQDAGSSDGGQDGGQDGGRSDAGPDGGQDGGGSPNPGEDGGRDGGGDGGQQKEGQEQPGDAGQGQPQVADGGTGDGGSTDGGASSEAQLNKQDAEKHLDSMKNNEKNLQLWRFQQKKPRKPNDQDW